MNKNKSLRFLTIPVVGILALLIVIYFLQLSMTLGNQRENSRTKLELAENRISAYDAEEEKDWESYDEFIQSKADMIALMIDSMGESSRQTSQLNEICDKWGLSGLYIVNDDAVISAKENTISQHTIDKFKAGADFDTDKKLELCYYTSKLSDGSMLIVAQESGSMLESEAYMTSISHALSDITVGSTGYVVAYESENEGDYSLAYAPENSEFSYENAIPKIKTLSDGYNDWFTLGDLTIHENNRHDKRTSDEVSFYVSVRDTEDYRLIAVVPADEIMGDVWTAVIIASIIFGCVLALLALYAIFLNKDINEKRISPKTIMTKLRIVSCIGLLCIFVMSLYTCFLTAVADGKLQLSSNLDSVESIINQNTEKTNQITKTYEDEYLSRAQRIAYLIQRCPKLINNKSMIELAKRGQLYSVNVFNEKGELDATSTVFTDYHLSTDESSQSYEFWNIIKGYDDYIIHDLQENETVKHDLVQYIGVKRLDNKGMIEIGVAPSRLKKRLYGDSLDEVLANIAVEDKGTVTYTDVDEDTPKEYFGFKNDGKIELVSTRIIDGKNIIVSVPITVMLKESLTITLIITILSSLIMLVFSISVYRRNRELINSYEEDVTEQINASGRLNSINTPWRKLTAGNKIARLVFYIIVGLTLVAVFGSRFLDPGNSNIVNFIMSRKWDLGLNLFSVSYILFVAIEIIFFSTLLRKLILFASIKNGGRAETFGRLFNSVIKYVTGIGTAFYSLYCLGVDTTTLLASAGILTLGVSLGAQSLVSDILAGLFIVFEGDFRVGDIVTVGDFRGTVREIGIRTTKIESPGNDVKIFKNSAISGVINMTKQHSFAAVDCGIEYGESIERVEAILQEELPLIKDRLPKIVDGPFYKGISELGDSSVVVKIVALCQEKDRIQLGRDLNREIKLIFDKHNVGIPFPQIVVNKPEIKVEATYAQKLKAKEFVEEQEELSKDIVADEQD